MFDRSCCISPSVLWSIVENIMLTMNMTAMIAMTILKFGSLIEKSINSARGEEVQ